MLLVTAERMLFTTAEGYCCKQWNGGFFGSSNAVFNVARQSEPTKEEIGLSSLESPALSIHLGAFRINGEIFKDQNGGFFGSSNTVFNVAPQPEPSKGTKALSFAILRLFSHQPRIQWRPCFRGFRDRANFIPSGIPGCGIRANDKAIVSHLLPVKFLVRLEAVKVKSTGSLAFEVKSLADFTCSQIVILNDKLCLQQIQQ